MKRKKVMITGELDGEKVFEIPMSAANDDWIRAGRLKVRADAGDKESAAELKRMEETPMVEISDENEDSNKARSKNEGKAGNKRKDKNKHR